MKVILMHGKDTNPQDKWYPWFAKQMQDKNIEYIAPTLPQPADPDINEWLSKLDETQPDEHSILIGHSRGGVAVLRWLEKLAPGKKISKVILVAANSGYSAKRNAAESNKGFYTLEGYDFEKIKQHCDNFVVFHSRDDKWVPFEAGEENTKGLNAIFHQFDDKGHFGKALGPFPELVKEIL